jgi:predicted DNA-binding protein (MmcQ/YjbR family)
MAFSTPSTNVNGAMSACSRSVGGRWVTSSRGHHSLDACCRASRALPVVSRIGGDVSVRPRTSVFKVAGKMFALSQLARHPLRVSLKCEPLLAEHLREAHSAVIRGYHLNKRDWNTVIIDGSLPEQMIEDMIEDSYDLVVSRLPVSRRRALGWPADAPR